MKRMTIRRIARSTAALLIAVLLVPITSASAQTSHTPNIDTSNLVRVSIRGHVQGETDYSCSLLTTCPLVHESISENLAAMLADLAASVSPYRISRMGGYRSAVSQLSLRYSHCGETPWEMLSKPSSECTPPTATPGNSMHEYGLAVDFTVRYATTRLMEATDAEFVWLEDNAADYGFHNLPSEPWHWSTNGR